MRLRAISLICAILSTTIVYSQTVDYSIAYVPEESGISFTRITSDNDYVCMPQVKRGSTRVDWLTNRIIDISGDGDKLAYLSHRGDITNIFIKEIEKQGSSIQRTSRRSVLDFSFSPDGKFLVFSEAVGGKNVIFQTDASSGFVCRQITSSDNDYSPVYSWDMKKIFFARHEIKSFSIWSYDLKDNFLSSYTQGMNPYPSKRGPNVLCVRTNGYGKGEIWRINIDTGIEECIVSDASKSFSTPSFSPNEEWIVFVGSSPLPYADKQYWNTDIYICRKDGSQLTQLTYHAADDLSPVWSKDGLSIYFVSQRGSATSTANIWKMNFNL